MSKAEQVLVHMWENDQMSKWLGLEVEQIRAGSCRLRFAVRQEMLNGFGTVHGGVLFAAADSAFAFACNSHGQLSVALNASINFIRPVKEGDMLVVEAREIHNGKKTGVYSVDIACDNALVACFSGTAFRTDKNVLDTEG